MGSHDVPGLLNLGNTCFLNALLQALASAQQFLDHVHGSSAPSESLTSILADCLEQLVPTKRRHSRLPVSSAAVLEALRGHTDDMCILDGQENDACEILHLLVSIIKDELQEDFWEHKSAALCSQAALQDILRFSWSCSSSNSALSPESTLERLTAAQGCGACQSNQQGCEKQSGKLTLQPGTEGEEAYPAVQADAAQVANMSAGYCSTTQGPSTQASSTEGSQAQKRSREHGRTGNADVSREASPALVRVHAAEQAEPILDAWRACRSPLEIGQAQEVACLVCRRHTSTTISTAVALPLVLPAVKGLLSDQAQPGATLDDLLRSHFAAHPIQDAVCTWCSLKWTLLEHQLSRDQRTLAGFLPQDGTDSYQQRSVSHKNSSSKYHREPQLPCEPCAHSRALQQAQPAQSASSAAVQPLSKSIQGPDPAPQADVDSMSELHCHHSARNRALMQQTEPAVRASSADAQLLEGCVRGACPLPEADVEGMAELHYHHAAQNRLHMQQPQPAMGAGSADVQLLEGCLRGACPLPEADVEGMTERTGLRWVQRRGTLLARTLVARAPEVLCLQLQRVRWSTFGSPEKLHGHVAFPLTLDLSTYRVAAAPPLLGRTLPQPAGKDEGLAQSLQCLMYQKAAMPPEQQKAQTPGTASMHGRRRAAEHDAQKAHCKADPSEYAYRLAAVIVHHGGPRSGHYSTYRSLLRTSEEPSDEQWVCTSDESVRDADVREVLACQASLLFYGKTHG